MAELVKCKSCGYVMEAGKLHDSCPACGVPAKMFEPFTDPVSSKRRSILALHIHPVLVHFPQAFAFFLFALSAASLALKGPARDSVISTLIVSALALPFVVFSAFLSGLVDGKVRFRKYSSSFLKIKITAASVFFITSKALAIMALKCPVETPSCALIFMGLSFVTVVCSIPLGIIGAWIAGAIFPG
jgi:uncharacterized membrane protein